VKLFDLNIEEVLEDWRPTQAVRELIANALDEQVLSGTKPIQIFKDERGQWHIRDFGRGLRIEHFTMNENEEKLKSEVGVIGKFGVGLKDALATLHRNGIDVSIHSSSGIFGVTEAQKAAFDGITTLHVEWYEDKFPIEGTDISLANLPDQDMDAAKNLFLTFSPERQVEETSGGWILERRGTASRIFINGVAVAEEQNFLFSYNLSRLTAAMKRKLNRERQNVGRSVYSDRVKAILKAAVSPEVQSQLCAQVQKRASGDQCDEMQWIEVSQHALTLYSKKREDEFRQEHERIKANPHAVEVPTVQRVAYLTEAEVQERPAVVDNLRRDRMEVVVVSETQKQRLEQQPLAGGEPVRTMRVYSQEYNESFHYTFVEPSSLTPVENRTLQCAGPLMRLVGIQASAAPSLRISETLRPFSDDTGGVWDPQIRSIIIKREKLQDLKSFGATLLHELAHASSGLPDVSRLFEGVLTEYLGMMAAACLETQSGSTAASGNADSGENDATPVPSRSVWDRFHGR
jgi:hypothetical protein